MSSRSRIRKRKGRGLKVFGTGRLPGVPLRPNRISFDRPRLDKDGNPTSKKGIRKARENTAVYLPWPKGTKRYLSAETRDNALGSLRHNPTERENILKMLFATIGKKAGKL